MTRNNKTRYLVNWLVRNKKIVTGIIFFVFTVCGINVYAIYDNIQSNKKLTSLESKMDKANRIVLSESTKIGLEKIDVTDFDEFDRINDIRFSENNELSIGKSNLAYFLSKKSLSEHVSIETKFTPLSDISNYYIIAENSFQIIIGDGDRQSVSLKSFSPLNTNWNEQKPDNCYINRPPKCFLKYEFPIGKEVKVNIDVNAQIIDENKRSVSLTIKFYNEDGELFDSLTTGDIRWNFEIDQKFNDRTRYGVGIIDPEALHPVIRFHYLKITEKPQ